MYAYHQKRQKVLKIFVTKSGDSSSFLHPPISLNNIITFCVISSAICPIFLNMFFNISIHQIKITYICF